MLINNLEIELERKRIRTLRLAVVPPDGRVHISAPLRCSESYIEKFVRDKWGWIVKKRAEITSRDYRPPHAYTPSEVLRLKKQLFPILDALIKKWEGVMNVKSGGFDIRLMRTRWGSCSKRDKSLRFNVRLIDTPAECVEYVVVHELAHLIEFNHSKRFYAVLDRYLPSWRTAKTTLDKWLLFAVPHSPYLDE